MLFDGYRSLLMFRRLPSSLQQSSRSVASRHWFLVTASLLGLLAAGNPACADERDEEIAALKARLERLEKLCERLLAEKEGKAQPGTPPANTPPPTDATARIAMVAGYGQEQNQKQAED